MNTLLGADGNPLSPSPREDVAKLRQQINAMMTNLANTRLAHRRDIRARFDAAQTFSGNQNHWGEADFLSPHLVASYAVRRTLRSRSRYELAENNPYLKGTCLTIVNDFVGSGPKLQITDERISEQQATIIQKKFMEWCFATKLRQKLWRMRLAKIVDGEAFLLPYINTRRNFYDPVQLDFQVIEADRITTQYVTPVPLPQKKGVWEIDGVRFDDNENPLEYYVLNFYPGYQGQGDRFNNPGYDTTSLMPAAMYGKWVNSKYLIHWFRQDRGWLRGVPEATSSLPLCAVLRRYTMAVVRNSEAMADITVLLESENPAGGNPFVTDANGNQLSDDPFDMFPLEMGMAMTLPWGYKSNQLQNVPLGIQFDEFVGSLLREITRPILSPYNISSGSSKDSNMASGVLDATIYKGGQRAERLSCEEEVMCRIFQLWFAEALLIPGHLGSGIALSDGTWKRELPQHRWRWDRIGIDHTDPARVAEALKTLHDKRILTDADIQEEYFNRDLGTWQEEVKRDDTFREGLIAPGLDLPPPPPEPGSSLPPGKDGKPPAKNTKKPKPKVSK